MGVAPAQTKRRRANEPKAQTYQLSESLLRTVLRVAATSFALLEAINVWRTHYFRGCEAKEWTGSAIDLHIAMANDEVLNKVLSKVIGTRNAFGRDLQNLVRQGTSWVNYRRTAAVRFYAISRPENL